MKYKDENGYVTFKCYSCNNPNTIIKIEYLEYQHRHGYMPNVCGHCDAQSLVELEAKVSRVWVSPYNTENYPSIKLG